MTLLTHEDSRTGQAADTPHRYTHTITRMTHDEFGVRFRIEYGDQDNFVGTIHTATDLSGRERSWETHTEEPTITFGWPDEELRGLILPELEQIARAVKGGHR